MKRRALAGAVLGVAVAASPAAVHAQGADRQARDWAAACAICHGTDGRAKQGMQALAGRGQQELYAALIEFKNGKRPATVMHQQAKGYTDQELSRIAAFFAAQRR